MAITNSDKPTTGIPETYLEVGSGFNLLVGGLFKLIIGPAGLGGLINTAKILGYETWDSITSTWASETATWDEASSTFSNTTKPSTSITNTAKPA